MLLSREPKDTPPAHEAEEAPLSPSEEERPATTPREGTQQDVKELQGESEAGTRPAQHATEQRMPLQSPKNTPPWANRRLPDARLGDSPASPTINPYSPELTRAMQLLASPQIDGEGPEEATEAERGKGEDVPQPQAHSPAPYTPGSPPLLGRQFMSIQYLMPPEGLPPPIPTLPSASSPHTPRPFPASTPATPSTDRKHIKCTERIDALDFAFSERRAWTADGYVEGAGQILISTPAMYPTLNTRRLGSHCSMCLRDEKQLREAKIQGGIIHCSGCEGVGFCLKCRVADFELNDHTSECQAFKSSLASSKRLPSTTVRLIAKVIRGHLRGEISRYPGFPSGSLQGAVKDDMLQIVEDVKDLLRLHVEALTDDFLLDAICCSIIPLYDDLAFPLGYCVSPILSSLKHDCDANAFIALPNGVEDLNSIKLISKQHFGEGDEVTISYIDPDLPIHLRDTAIASHGFLHASNCAICSVKGADIRWASIHRCSNGESGILPLVVSGYYGDNAVEPDARESRYTACCSQCKQMAPCMSMEDTEYSRLMKIMEWSIGLESAGVSQWYDSREKPHIIQDSLDSLYDVLSPCTYRLSPLLYRLARYRLREKLSGDPVSHYRSLAATFINLAGSLIEINEESWSPQVFFVHVHLARTYIKLYESLKRQFDNQSLSPVPEQHREYQRSVRRSITLHVKILRKNLDHTGMHLSKRACSDMCEIEAMERSIVEEVKSESNYAESSP